MFTGIISSLGAVEKIDKKVKNPVISVITGGENFLDDVKQGSSISVNGACLTVISAGKNRFAAELSAETISRTIFKSCKKGDLLNLEKAVTPGKYFDGHMVTGHIDGCAKVVEIRSKNGREIYFEVPEELSAHIVDKGSIAVNGVSLTVCRPRNNSFSVHVIPHTWDSTNLRMLRRGDLVNVEVDIISKYIEKHLSGKKTGRITKERLKEQGYIR